MFSCNYIILYYNELKRHTLDGQMIVSDESGEKLNDKQDISVYYVNQQLNQATYL